MERDPAVTALLEALRAEVPAVAVETEHTYHDAGFAVVRARIALPGGGVATGHGSAEGAGEGVVELAEDRALARALASLGYEATAMPAAGGEAGATSGLHPVGEAADEPGDPFNLGASPSAAAVAAATGMRLGVQGGPARTPARTGRTETAEAPAGAPEAPVATPDEPAVEHEADAREAAPRSRGGQRRGAATAAEGDEDAPEAPALADGPDDEAAGATPPAGRERGPGRQRAAPAPVPGEDDESDVSHRGFWSWAARYGLENKDDVEALLGQSISGMMPARVRELIIAAHEGEEDDS